MSSEFDISRNITIGQYVPTGSFIHRLDPRIKLLIFVFLVVAIALNTSYIGNAVGLILSLYLFWASKIPISYGLSGVKPAIPFIIILAVLQLLFQGQLFSGGKVFVDYGFILITSESIRLVIVSAVRFIEIIFLSSVLTLSTSTTELTHSIQSLLSPLKKMNFPVHEISLITTISIRFVPTFAIEMEKMMKAQASRGADFGSGSWWRIIQRTKEMFPIIIPLFNIALARAEDLILAMEARCYTPGGERSTYSVYKAVTKDYLILLVGLLLTLLLLFYPFPI
ncbi:energy-coupling factor transporter transmembrane component T [Neobacillus sp. OS1-32]|jgi:energy-coupling factor transport system permease protein|uniref:Energy-coupling factor transporter transmembrane protein EcfT n=1 Tax=Neobacillus paridis TaxID=2803862 RepID=A0ABS1TN89_9BACI|nr:MULTISPECIES: energy-coupling factor transporter transmembrane component T [Neobacillus]MBL4952776.1 energy-coupling factor transporter transmembrane protein EcfT [Neobacillus paridis]WML31699.1 energy-coupling factor transporter transmembrane component T [Neobacillus sp. OS1-32]